LPTSHCGDGSSGNPVAVAHSYCYKLLSAQSKVKEHTEIWWTAIWLTRWLSLHWWC